MPVVSYTLSVVHFFYMVIYDFGTSEIFWWVIHFRPLEWSKRFWNKERRTYCNLAFTISFFLWDRVIIKHGHLICKFRNSTHILLCLGWKTKHKIKLYFIPSTFKCLSWAIHNIFYGKTFVYNISKPLSSGFRCKCKTALFDVLYLLHYV